MASPAFLYPVPRSRNNDDLREQTHNGSVSQPFLFSGVEFIKPVNLAGIRFDCGVEFRRCIFHESVNFSGAQFRGYARFWKSIFKKPADFKYAVFKKLETGPIGSTENGEANFSWSRFEEDADFLWAKFEGPAFFWRTVFEKFAKLEATFNSSAIFEGDPSLVSIERGDLGSYSGLFDGLNHAGLLSQDNEDANCAMMSSITDQEALEEKLKAVGFNADSISQVRSVLRRLQAGVFPPLAAPPAKTGASFCGARFEEPEAVTFRNISLEACRFANSNAGRAKFQNVKWDRQPTLLWAADRRASRDERPAGFATKLSIEELRALSTLYNDLRVSHEQRGLFDDAIDFQYGEIESKRLAQSTALRHVSLAAWYRYLSAYGARPGLALTWLLLGIFLLFPVLYLLTGYSQHPVDAIIHSLETSTFLEVAKSGSETAKNPLLIAPRFVAGFERLAVTFQAALFALAVQQKFGRR